jgi:hypothetical protein
MMEFAARTAQERTEHGWSGDPVDPRWRLHLILVSDGGKALQAPNELSALGSVFRAIDLNGLETGPLRPIPNDDKPPTQMLSYLSSLTFSPDLIVMGKTMDDFRDHPGIFFADVDDDTLLSLTELVPDKAAARQAVEGFRKAQAEPKRDPNNRSKNCVTGNPDPVVLFACARANVERLVGADIWRAMNVFRETPTLDDSFSTDQADAIFRFGQYLVRLKWPCIHQKLNEAAQLPTSPERRLC